MNKKTMMTLGIALMFLGTTTAVTAYHIPHDNGEYNKWTLGNGLVTLCESTGSTDKVNDLPAGQGGTGGLCYMSSQSYSTCVGPDMVGDYACTYNKTADKEKKPIQDDQATDYGYIEPTCDLTTDCPAADGSDKNGTGVGQSWFIRISSNARSCNGAWGQTFIYKEAVAYYGGDFPNPETGASGHVEFFVTLNETEAAAALLGELDFSGGYNAKKEFHNNPGDAGIDTAKTLNTGQVTPNCTGNASSWGLSDDSLGSAYKA